MGKSSINNEFSIAMVDYRRVFNLQKCRLSAKCVDWFKANLWISWNFTSLDVAFTNQNMPFNNQPCGIDQEVL